MHLILLTGTFMGADTQRRPRVSIGLPVYNGERLLRQAVDSILDQTFTDFELIISDNGSTDSTGAIGREYVARDPRVRYVQQPTNLGAAGNFNYVLGQATGEYFKWAAHDDRLEQDFLSACVRVLDDDPDTVLSFAEVGFSNDDGSPLAYDDELGAYVDRYGKSWYRARVARDTASSDPVQRFVSVVVRDSWCLEVFGLIRRASLRRTSLIGGYYGSDKTLLAELATLGRFHTNSRLLFWRGCQPTQSSYLSPQEQAVWIRGASSGFHFDQASMLVGLLRAATRSSLTIPQQIRCMLAVLRMGARPDKLKRIFLPGPQNYFGFGAARRPATPAPQACSAAHRSIARRPRE